MFTRQLTAHFKELWAQSPEDFPGFTSSFHPAEKREREMVFTEYTRKFRELEIRRERDQLEIDPTRFFSGFRGFMNKVYNYSDDALDLILDPSFTGVSRSFFDQAKAFDPELKKEEIFQAMRNVWIMNGLQLLLDIPVKMDPSLFSYSLLYPYSDNLLDDPAVSSQEKAAFSMRFLERLKGRNKMGPGRVERKISELVGIIEDQYPRHDYPELYKSLLAIHHAQTQSIRLLQHESPLTENEILDLVFDKGGSSVLADGFLVAGRPTEEQQKFFFGYGIWLQLVDDLQDMTEDTASGTVTLFSSSTDKTKRVERCNRIFHFGRRVMDCLKWCSSDVYARFSEMMVQSIELMLIQSVGLNHRYFPEEYCNRIEVFSPVGFDFLRDAREKGTPGRMRMITRLMELKP
jgi:hypothetical protein